MNSKGMGGRGQQKKGRGESLSHNSGPGKNTATALFPLYLSIKTGKQKMQF